METIQPTAEAVYEHINAMHNNPDCEVKSKSARWLEDLQSSVYSWTLADEILHQKRDMHSCYFAAQTLRNKIQSAFQELPVSSHESLRASLVAHIKQVNNDTAPLILTQLCLALSDLALLMTAWENPVMDLVQELSRSPDTILALLTIISLIPEEINSRYLCLGANRRADIHRQLESNSKIVSDLLALCLANCKTNAPIMHKVIRCFNSWLGIHAILVTSIAESPVVGHCFTILRDFDQETKLHDAAADGICTLLQCFNAEKENVELERMIFERVCDLETAYVNSVAHEDVDKAMTYCRIFTVLAESFLDKMVNQTSHNNVHYSMKSLDLVLNCVSHYDYEVAEITFSLWYRLSEELYRLDNDQLQRFFQPHVERLIIALYKHSQMDSDHEGLIDESEAYYEFRRKVSEIIKDVVFIIGSSNCFKQMFLMLQEPNVPWDRIEAALFIMETVAKNIDPNENEVIPKVVEAILNLPENTHVAVRYTSIMMLGELADWIEQHPESLQSILNFLLYALQQRNGLAPAGASALTLICSSCRERMMCHLSGLVQISKSLDSYEISNDLAIGLLKGISIIITCLPRDDLSRVLHEICSFQLTPLCQLVETDVKVEKYQRSDPSFWLDRLAAVFRHTNPIIGSNEMHPCLTIVTESFVIISRILEKFQADLRIMERTCRCIRYALRCVREQASPLLEGLVKQMIYLYELHQHSCFLYLGSVLVDEFAGPSSPCTQGLLLMTQAFVEPTFKKLQNGLKNHPDTVDDFFRLCSRLILRAALQFLQSPMVAPILECALLACTLDHRDANLSVMKFFTSLLGCSRDPEMEGLVRQIIQLHGEALVMNLLHASIFSLHSFMLCDVADVFGELKAIDEDKVSVYLRKALDTLPRKSSAGCVTATIEQLDDFHSSLIKADSVKGITRSLKDFTRLFR